MSNALLVSGITLIAVLLLMLVESRLSVANERALRALGAVEPKGDVYRIMRWAYPASFVAMAFEGTLNGPAPRTIAMTGLGILAGAKTLKYWAIASLGSRWTFRVLVPPMSSRVRQGPYLFLRHPNYVGVLGEIVGMALIVAAPLSGMAAFVGFAALIQRRIQIEERALECPPC